ncbi:MAG: 50S ribosomal protein L35 [Candidatus Brocadiia bacterium]
MPKLKTHKGLAARVRVTRNKKIVRRKAGKSHLMSSKSGKKSRQLRHKDTLKGKFAKEAVRKLGGY